MRIVWKQLLFHLLTRFQNTLHGFSLLLLLLLLLLSEVGHLRSPHPWEGSLWQHVSRCRRHRGHLSRWGCMEAVLRCRGCTKAVLRCRGCTNHGSGGGHGKGVRGPISVFSAHEGEVSSDATVVTCGVLRFNTS